MSERFPNQPDSDPVMDALLEEVLGSVEPPDLSEGILRTWVQRNGVGNTQHTGDPSESNEASVGQSHSCDSTESRAAPAGAEKAHRNEPVAFPAPISSDEGGNASGNGVAHYSEGSSPNNGSTVKLAISTLRALQATIQSSPTWFSAARSGGYTLRRR